MRVVAQSWGADGGIVPTQTTAMGEPVAGLEPTDQDGIRSALARVSAFAEGWHQGQQTWADLPHAVGAELRYVALPAATSILGLSICPDSGPPTIVLNEGLIANPVLEAMTICHEAFHIVAGFKGIARCDNAWVHDPMERLAWLAPSLFMVPEALGLECTRTFDPLPIAIKHNLHTSLIGQRAAIAVLEGKAAGDPRYAMAYLDSSAYSFCAWLMMAFPTPMNKRAARPPAYQTHPDLQAVLVVHEQAAQPGLIAPVP